VHVSKLVDEGRGGLWRPLWNIVIAVEDLRSPHHAFELTFFDPSSESCIPDRDVIGWQSRPDVNFSCSFSLT
jgi:hypothetical protein